MDTSIPNLPSDLSTLDTNDIAQKLIVFIGVSRQMYYESESFKPIPTLLIANIQRLSAEYTARLLLSGI